MTGTSDSGAWADSAAKVAGPEQVIRVALVMNGGVSLAVWMGGVTHEINRLLGRASTAPSPAWLAILAVPDGNANAHEPPRRRRVIVDTVAGTSAGGLNGALLATAIARNADMPPLRGLWEDAARLTVSALLPEPGDDTSALLDGEFFHQTIVEQLNAISPGDAETVEPSDVTLLVTSTAMSGGQRSVEDANNHKLATADHRRVYRFEKRSDPTGPVVDDFIDGTVLSLCARASASFPVAFPPVLETAEMKERDIASPGPLQGPTSLIDGGVLDNAPFEPVLDEIVARSRPDPGKRWLVYVVPSAEGLGKRRPSDRSPRPPEWWGVLGSLWGLKSEVDLRNDVDALRRVQASSRAVHHRPETLIASHPVLGTEAVDGLLPLYRRARARGIMQFIVEGPPDAAIKLEVVAPTEKDLDDIATAAWFIPTSRDPFREGRWQWGTSVARRMSLWLSRHARQIEADSVLIGTLSLLERRIGAADQATRNACQIKGATGTKPAAFVGGLAANLSAVNAELDGVMVELLDAAGQLLEVPAREAWERLVAVEVATNFSEIHDRPTPPELDVLLVDTGAPQVGKFVLGKSESDTELGKRLQRDPNAKLYGTRLGHFGAFGHSEYRRHDYQWGRLDAALCLASALLEGVDGSRADELRRRLIAEIMNEEATSTTQVVDRTRRMVGWSNRKLALESVTRDEVELSSLVESVERALTRLGAQHASYPWIVKVADEFGDTLKHAGGVEPPRHVRRLSSLRLRPVSGSGGERSEPVLLRRVRGRRSTRRAGGG